MGSVAGIAGPQNLAPKSGIVKSKGTPIDPTGSLDLQSLAAQRLNWHNSYLSQIHDINRNYTVQRRRTVNNEPYTIRGIRSNYAGRGGLFSTGYASAQGREAQLYNQGLNDLDYAHQQGLDTLHGQNQSFNRTYGVQKLQVQQAAADRLAANAGTLNLGNGTALTPKQIARLLGGGHPNG